MGFGNGVDFLSKPIASGWGWEMVLTSCQQSRIKNGGLRKVLSTRGGRWCSRQCRKMVSSTVGNAKTFQSKCPCSNRGDLYLPLFVPLNKATAVRARPPDPENQKSRLPTRIHQNRGTMPQGKPEFRGNRFGSRGIEVAAAFAPMNCPGRVRQAALIG